ncbi:hypothetical protein K443DRAFT_11939 [Laccaria amethystina LaAM-08-1]|uniref:Uncharacterized protein n=1 Tax=Laccaria amethystina LaAM-08-1 TaxID=1095629 RepID=A0A0C9XAC7_9AGAR|nr:hypothetical protein K443DRAFT_11939 [Laccaria amethystina LaAM-08-1]
MSATGIKIPATRIVTATSKYRLHSHQLHAVETTRPSTPSTILHWALVMTMNVLVTWMGLKTHSALCADDDVANSDFVRWLTGYMLANLWNSLFSRPLFSVLRSAFDIQLHQSAGLEEHPSWGNAFSMLDCGDPWSISALQAIHVRPTCAYLAARQAIKDLAPTLPQSYSSFSFRYLPLLHHNPQRKYVLARFCLSTKNISGRDIVT